MFDPMLAFQTFESTSLTELSERIKWGPRKFVSNLFKKTRFYSRLNEWAVEPYTQQPWSHVMSEPLLQFGPGGLILTVRRHVAVLTTGVSVAACLQYIGYKKPALYVLGGLTFFFVSVRSIIWVLMNWK